VNVAAASARTNNGFSVDAEYYHGVGGAKTQIGYRIRAGTPIVDTDAYPSNGCTPASGYTACLTDHQLRAELNRITSSKGLATDLAHFYPVFYPEGLDTKDRDGTTSAGDFCGYHRPFGSGSNQTVYSDEPYNASSGCNRGQHRMGASPQTGRSIRLATSSTRRSPIRLATRGLTHRATTRRHVRGLRRAVGIDQPV
jgi:hypothetical protein